MEQVGDGVGVRELVGVGDGVLVVVTPIDGVGENVGGGGVSVPVGIGVRLGDGGGVGETVGVIGGSVVGLGDGDG